MTRPACVILLIAVASGQTLAAGIAATQTAAVPSAAAPSAATHKTGSATTSSQIDVEAIDPALWRQMSAVDARAAHITSLRADFKQEKFTPLMKRPLISSGTLAACGTTALWITRQPEPTRMLVTDREIDLYYPAQSAEEIYPVGGKLGSLASSPLPRLDALRRFFRFTQIPVGDLDPAGDESRELALQLQPLDAQLREHVARVRVLLDRSSGLVKIAETTDPDGERTLLTFSNVQVNAQLSPGDLKLAIPPGTSVSHPLGDLGTGDLGTGDLGTGDLGTGDLGTGDLGTGETKDGGIANAPASPAARGTSPAMGASH